MPLPSQPQWPCKSCSSGMEIILFALVLHVTIIIIGSESSVICSFFALVVLVVSIHIIAATLLKAAAAAYCVLLVGVSSRCRSFSE